MIQSLKNLKNFYPLLRGVKNEIIESIRFGQKEDFLTSLTLNSNKSGVTEKQYGNSEVIVSLTTFGRRLSWAYLTIESLMQQTMPANRIVLWISEDFKGQELPMCLQLQMLRGLEIRYCKDIRSYTKLIPSLRAFPNATIITVDDDLIYDSDVLETLIVPHLKNPNVIYANRIHKMKKNNEGTLMSYMDWEWHAPYTGGVDKMNFLTGVGGVLYPPKSLDPEVLHEEVFLDICKYADDVWFTAMALKANTPIVKTQTFNVRGEGYIDNIYVQDTALHNQNIDPNNCRNDIQIKAVFKKYDIYSKL